MNKKTICEKCEKRDRCKKSCDKVNALLWKDNRVMEKKAYNRIVTYPKKNEVRFSEISQEQIDNFTTSDVVPWASGDLRLRKTIVFVERFFNKTPCKVLADRFGVKENTIVCMYQQAVEQLEKIVEKMDSRKEGIKAMKADKFNEDQKYFLLVAVFGFSQAEVARMFRRNKDTVNKKVKRMSDRYEAVFSEQVEV
ncbi:MAG TPA: hypothetical protein PKV75_06465 [Desulfobacterales bacterium]|nr:hypothetical protein [Desulfobacterales bacterium]